MRLIVIFLSVFLALVVFMVVYNMDTGKGNVSNTPGAVVSPKADNIEVAQVDVMVARRDIPIGTLITAQDVDTQPWPSHLAGKGFVTSQDPTVIGMVTRSALVAQEPIIRSKLANPNDPSFLAAALPKGMRAVTIPVDGISGLAGFVFPGDKVDVLSTFTIIKKGSAASAKDEKSEETSNCDNNRDTVHNTEKCVTITEVLVPNVRVMAVDQKSGASVTDTLKAPSSVTVEVSQRDAQRILLAQKGSNLSLSLRSLKDEGDSSVVRPTGVGDLSRTTPPAYFPVLYNFGEDMMPQQAADDSAQAMVAGEDSVVSVVRGAKAEIVEINRP